jgi:hypothetical protein
MEHRIAAGVGSEGGEFAGEQERSGQQGDEEGADSVPFAHDASWNWVGGQQLTRLETG